MNLEFAQYRKPVEEFVKLATLELHKELVDIPNFIPNEASCVSWRLKSDAAIAQKRANQRMIGRLASERINDFIGFRLVCPHLGLLHDAGLIIEKWAATQDLHEVNRQDKFSSPGLGGYRAIHFDFRFNEENYWKFPHFITVELQLTTWLQCLHNQLSHCYLYKSQPGNDQISHDLEAMGAEVQRLDKRVAEYYLSRFQTAAKSSSCDS